MAAEPHPERVPDAESASADEIKFTGYLLNETHTQGKSKAKFFRNSGYDESNWRELRDAMLNQLPSIRATHSKSGYAGAENYEAVVVVEAPNGTIHVRTFWEVHPQTGTRFLTAFPLDSEKL